MPPSKMAKTSPETVAAAAADSAEIVAENADLLTEILLRLPAKSLIRFKSVSKHWLSLISDPEFSLRRSSLPGPASGLFLKRPGIEYTVPVYDSVDLTPTTPSCPPFRSASFPEEDRNIRSGIEILQSCNGLLLCRSVTRNYYYVYNPTTKQLTTLPALRSPEEVYGLALAFDPAESPHYKVVCVRTASARDHSRFRVEVYSSDTGPWRPSGQPEFEADSFQVRFERGFFWSGSVHWIAPWGLTSPRFDLREDRLRHMPMPPVPDHLETADRSFGYFGVSGGHFHFVDHAHEPGDRHFDVFELKRDYSGWFVKYRVDVSEVLKAFPEMVPGYDFRELLMRDYLLSVLCVVRCEVEEESYLVMSVPGKILRYNFKSQVFYKVCDVEPSRGVINDEGESQDIVLEPSEAHQYIQSLVCV